MTTYARIVDGLAIDVVVTPPTLAERFNPEWLAKQTFYIAPDGTLSGRPATVNPDDSVTWGANPEPAAPKTTPEIPINHSEQHRALVLGRARELDKKGKYNEANALRATIGE